MAQVNTRLRPDLALARAWDRVHFAEQSTLSRTLEGFSAPHVQQLRLGCETLFRQHSQTLCHDFKKGWLWLDIDLTPLPISKHAEGSSKGKMGEKTPTVDSWVEFTPLSIMKP